MPLGTGSSGKSHGTGGRTDAHAHRLQLADAAIADILDRLPELAVEFAPLLAAGLKDDLIGSHRLDDLPTLGNRVRQRLLAVDVLLGLGRQHAAQSVPVVGRGDHHGVDVVAGQKLAEIAVNVAALVLARLDRLGILLLDGFLGIRGPLGDDVAYGNHLHIAEAQKPVHMAAAHRPHADEAQADALVG